MGILEHVKDITELIKAYDNQDLYPSIVDLRSEILDLQEQNLLLRAENDKLKQDSQTAAELTRYENEYYRSQDRSRMEPFCTVCWDADRKLIGLTKTYQINLDGARTGKSSLHCGRCKRLN